MNPMNIQRRYYRVNPRDICFIRYTFEAHDGLAVVSTPPGSKDIIVLRIAPGCMDEVMAVVEGLKQELEMDETDAENGVGGMEIPNL